MPIEIVLTYVFGIIFLILALEDEREVYNLIYGAISIFINGIAYYLSYTDASFVSLAYLPLGMSIISLFMLVYRVYGYLPKGDNPWGEDEEKEEYRFKQEIS